MEICNYGCRGGPDHTPVWLKAHLAEAKRKAAAKSAKVGVGPDSEMAPAAQEMSRDDIIKMYEAKTGEDWKADIEAKIKEKAEAKAEAKLEKAEKKAQKKEDKAQEKADKKAKK